MAESFLPPNWNCPKKPKVWLLKHAIQQRLGTFLKHALLWAKSKIDDIGISLCSHLATTHGTTVTQKRHQEVDEPDSFHFEQTTDLEPLDFNWSIFFITSPPL